MYADDTVLLSKGDSHDEVIAANQIVFDRYIHWADLNCLKINIKKTKQMNLCSRSKNHTTDTTYSLKKEDEITSNTWNYIYL